MFTTTTTDGVFTRSTYAHIILYSVSKQTSSLKCFFENIYPYLSTYDIVSEVHGREENSSLNK